ncbi:MAG: hypothetical protein ACPGTU_17390, partial [Myxococcota bacterium]
MNLAAQDLPYVFPGELSPFLDPQSWLTSPNEAWTELEVDILPSVDVYGTVVGYEATPYGAEVPGAADTPVSATISVNRPETVGGASTTTEMDGSFSLRVPPSHGYQLIISPDQGDSLPFYVQTNTVIDTDLNLEVIDLGYGEPVYGQIFDDQGEPISGCGVYLQDETTGATGQAVYTNQTGHFMLRAHPGSYTIIAAGRLGRTLPRIAVPVEVLEDDTEEIFIDMGPIEPVTVMGQMFGPLGQSVQRDIRVRFSSSRLSDSEGTLEIETETDGDGLFSRSLLPGDWNAEFIPPYDSDLAPLEMTFSVRGDQEIIDLGTVTLPERMAFTSTARDQRGNAIAGVAVNARERGFDGYIHSATSNAEGNFTLDVPPSPLDFMLIPPDPNLAVTRLFVNPSTDSGSITLAEGELVEGRITSDGFDVPYALIEIRDPSGELYATALTGPDGSFSVRIDTR